MTKQHQLSEETPTGQIGEVEVIEVEEYARAGRPVPRKKRYRIRVDKERFVVEQHAVTGEEILALVHKAPDTHHLYQHIRGGQTRLVEPTEATDLTAPGVERFTTLKLENTEGASFRP